MKNFGSILTRAGALFFVLGLAILSSGFAQAAGLPQTYQETQTVTKWHNAKFCRVSSSTLCSGLITLGPAEWTVSGTMGSTTFGEKWVAGDYKRTAKYSGNSSSSLFNIEYADEATSRFTSSTVVNPNAQYASQAYSVKTESYGFYQGYGYYLDPYISSLSESVVFQSVPSKWTINGSITTN